MTYHINIAVTKSEAVAREKVKKYGVPAISFEFDQEKAMPSQPVRKL